MYLEILSYIQNKNDRLKDLEEIFFLNAKAPLDTEEKKQLLFKKYASPYIENWPDDVFFVCDLDTKKTMGYLIGCRDSQDAAQLFEPLLSSYSTFSDQFNKYPAHLHMNIHPEYHGRGAGTFLIQEYIIELKKFKLSGVHIVTSPGERNVIFYNRNKFSYKLEREHNHHKLLFMGLSL